MDTSLVTFGRGLGHLSMSCKFLLRDLQETRSWKQRALDKLEKQIGPSIDDQIRKLRMQLREVGCSESLFLFCQYACFISSARFASPHRNFCLRTLGAVFDHTVCLMFFLYQTYLVYF